MADFPQWSNFCTDGERQARAAAQQAAGRAVPGNWWSNMKPSTARCPKPPGNAPASFSSRPG